MPRIFVGIDLPDEIDQHLDLLCGGVPGARWEGRDKFHLTLRFVGDTDGGIAAHVGDALADVQHAPFAMTLAGVGFFPPRGQPRSLWAGVDDPKPVAELHRRIERALAKLGLEPDARKFAAHVTLGRLRDAPEDRVAAFLAHHSLFRSAPFEVRAFQLFSSIRTPAGSKYRIERAYPLV
ncbi:MAG TPA: RNA 2',3'-cyclic phosphodiesterase [Nannocystaceae bacterium]|nr:RNA 2',3'-cyclic phosphodiesterase [Nannocystaceae bacterium]